MVEYLKNQERDLKRSLVEIKKIFLKPVYYSVEGISILLGYFWINPFAELIYMKYLRLLADTRIEIIAKEKKGE